MSGGHGESRMTLLTHIFQLLDTNSSGVIEDLEWHRILNSLDTKSSPSDPLDYLRAKSKPITFDEVVASVKSWPDQRIEDLLWFVESVVRVEEEIRAQRSKGIREWKHIVELLLSEGIAQYSLSTQPEKVRNWLSIRIKNEYWLSAGGGAGSSISKTVSATNNLLSEAEVQYLFEIEAPNDMASSIDTLIPFYEASTVLKRMVHPNYVDLTLEENNQRLREAFDRLLENLDTTKVSTELARSIACVIVVKDGLDLLLRILRLSLSLENGLKTRINTIIQLILEFHFEYSTEPLEKEVRARIIQFAELRAKTKAPNAKTTTDAFERQNITTWVRLILSDPKQNFRVKAVEQLLQWAERNDGVSEEEADRFVHSNDPLKRKRPSLLLTEGVMEIILDRINVGTYYMRHEPHPGVRANLVYLLFAILRKGGDSGRNMFRKREGIQTFRLLLKDRSGAIRRHRLPPGREMDEFNLDGPFQYLNSLDRLYLEDAFTPKIVEITKGGHRKGSSVSLSDASDSELETSPRTASSTVVAGNAVPSSPVKSTPAAASRQQSGTVTFASAPAGKSGVSAGGAGSQSGPKSTSGVPERSRKDQSFMYAPPPEPAVATREPENKTPQPNREDAFAVIDVLRKLLNDSLWGANAMGQELLHCVDILETLVNVDPIPYDLINCCLSHPMIQEHLSELVKQEGENAMIHWGGLVDPIASHMGACFAAAKPPSGQLEPIKQMFIPVLGKNSVLNLFGYARHRLDIMADGLSATDVTQRKLAVVMLAKVLPVDLNEIMHVVLYAHHLLHQFLVVCGCRKYRKAFFDEVASFQSGAYIPDTPIGWDYGSIPSLDICGSTHTRFTTPKFYLSSSVSPFIVDENFGAASKDEDSQARLLRFRLLCVVRLIQLIGLKFRLPGFVTMLQNRILNVLQLTDAGIDEPNPRPSLYSTVENGTPAWMVVARLSAFPIRPSFRIMYPNHTLTTLARSICDIFRLLERMGADDASPNIDEATRRSNADKFSSLFGFMLFELCIFERDSLTMEFSGRALQKRFGVTSADMQNIHRITEEESFRIQLVNTGGSPDPLLPQVFQISDETNTLPKLYFVLLLNTSWYLFANNPNTDGILTDGRDVNWHAFSKHGGAAPVVIPQQQAPGTGSDNGTDDLDSPR